MMKRQIILLLFLVSLPLAGVYASPAEDSYNEGGGGIMRLSSPDFKNDEFIPEKFTCEGEDINPSLVIEGIPGGAKSLVLIVDDPDAPAGTWVHWMVFDIPVLSRIEENSVPGKLGITNSGKKDYHGPCPPSGVHRYYFKIYALDTLLNLKEGVNRGVLEKAMQKHVLDQAQLRGFYRKKN